MGKAIPLNQIARLQQRCDAVNRMYRKDKSSYKRAVFIHVDSRARNNQTDVYFIMHRAVRKENDWREKSSGLSVPSTTAISPTADLMVR